MAQQSRQDIECEARETYQRFTAKPDWSTALPQAWAKLPYVFDNDQ